MMKYPAAQMQKEEPQKKPHDEGRITVLLAGMLALILSVFAVTSSLNHVAIAQRKLTSIADSATSSAALGRAQTKAIQGSGEPDLTVARKDLLNHLQQLKMPDALDEIQVDQVRFSGNPLTLHVTMSARTKLPILGGVLPGSVRVDTHAVSRIRVR